MTAAEVANVLAGYRFNFGSEDRLHAAIAKILTEGNVRFEREVRLDEKNRVDFLLSGGVVIEAKVAGNKNRSALLRQLLRYASQERVSEILVVSGGVLVDMPDEIKGKPVVYHYPFRSF